MQRATAQWLATAALGILIVSIAFAGSTGLLSPGPLTASHSTLKECSSCHAKIKPGPVGWMHSIFAAAEPRADTMACLSCHKFGDQAVNPHTARLDLLEQITNRVQSRNTPPSNMIGRVREAVFPVSRTFPDGVYCQTCHKEHKGKMLDLVQMSDNRCQACHSVKLQSFAEDHPGFGSYPFKRRTRIFFDHNTHFEKHFPEHLQKKPSDGAVPEQCSNCHQAAAGGRRMTVKPFKQMCSSCHSGEITGEGRAEGPKGITLLSLPGLDVETLDEKGVEIGQWPVESEGELTPFMELLLGRDPDSKKMLRTIKEADLFDLTGQPDHVIADVEKFVWETKKLFSAFTRSKPSEMMERLNAASVQVEPELAVRLSASIPRDVLMSAQNQWLPNLEAELSARRAKAKDNGEDSGPEKRSEAANGPGLDLDAEAWAEFGGWYRQDHAILYKPTGHKDAFIKAWLDLSASLFREGSTSAAVSIFQQLTSSDAQGKCTKCHSVDAASDGSRRINWTPFDAGVSREALTSFSHHPHLSVIGKDGCLTCHALNPTANSKASYEQLNPARFVSNFHNVKIETCKTCHTQDAVRDNCLLCHNYHARPPGTTAPVTKLPGL